MAGISDLYNQVLKDHRNYPRNKGLIAGYKTLKVKTYFNFDEKVDRIMNKNIKKIPKKLKFLIDKAVC